MLVQLSDKLTVGGLQCFLLILQQGRCLQLNCNGALPPCPARGNVIAHPAPHAHVLLPWAHVHTGHVQVRRNQLLEAWVVGEQGGHAQQGSCGAHVHLDGGPPGPRGSFASAPLMW